MRLTVLIDSSKHGHGAILLGNDKPLAMFSRVNVYAHRHSSEAELEGLALALQAFCSYFLGREFQVFTDNWASLIALTPGNYSTFVLRRLDHILFWFPSISFVSGKENQLADFLSRSFYWRRVGTTEAVPQQQVQQHQVIDHKGLQVRSYRLPAFIWNYLQSGSIPRGITAVEQ